MMRYFNIVFFSLTALVALSQNKYDTLYFGTKKFALQKVKIFRDHSQHGPVFLPSEYKKIEIENWGAVPYFKYEQKADTTFGIESDDENNLIVTSRWEFNCDTIPERKYYLDRLLDTIIIRYEDFGKVVPYIKTGAKKINFSAATIDASRDGKIGKHNIYYLLPNTRDWNLFSYWDNKSKSVIKSSTLILHDLYYLKGKETYYLDRKFIILIE